MVDIMKVEYHEDYYPNGQPYWRCPYVNGVPHGTVKSYYSNGQLEYEVPYVNGVAHGTGKWYYDNGELRRESIFIGGRLYGVTKIYNRAGRLVDIKYFWKGQTISKRKWKAIPRLTKVLTGVTDE